MGGLTVLRALREQLPQANFVYLGDTARLPYGTKSPSTVAKYAEQAASVLVDRGVGAIVVACNTASGIALESLQSRFAPLPVFGVVEPGAQAACEVVDDSGVLVLATESTVAWGAYQRAISNTRSDAKIFARACPLWVAVAEQGISEGDLADAVIGHDLRGFEHTGPRTLLLGCTHFPVFTETLKKRLPNHQIVDSAATTARVVASVLSHPQTEKLGTTDTHSSGSRDSREDTQCFDGESAKDTQYLRGQVSFLATDGVARFKRVGSFFLGESIDEVELIDL
ncbi:MAG: glutamate racemase [Pseudomonadales bacterium]|nr:glutamate racemase [Pseudomonadales bacterium]